MPISCSLFVFRDHFEMIINILGVLVSPTSSLTSSLLLVGIMVQCIHNALPMIIVCVAYFTKSTLNGVAWLWLLRIIIQG